MRKMCGLVIAVLLPLSALSTGGCTTISGRRCSFWIDMYSGEPVLREDMLEDLAGARVIYIGECHTLARHHKTQRRIVSDLARGVPIVLAMEQMEAFNQPALDRYAAGEISFEELAKQTDWAERWANYQQYRHVLETARKTGAPMVALNARAEIIREVGRKGLDGLDAEQREQLPSEMSFDDPMYERHLRIRMMMHASVEEDRLRKMFEAQVSRDEAMADRLAAFMQTEQAEGRTAIVLIGAGHVSHGLGTPDRVRRRMPGIEDRIIVLTESGDLKLPPKVKAMMREITITHEQLRHLQRPFADYLFARRLKP